MLSNTILVGERIMLRNIELSDCNEIYLSWLNDNCVNRFLETRLYPQTMQTIIDFVTSIKNSDNSILFAIIDKKSNQHIGNIKLGPIHQLYRYADISYFIGDKAYWNKGLGTEAVKLLCTYGLENLKLHRLQAGVIEGNDASVKVLQKAGFVFEARLKDKFVLEEQFCDHLLYRIISDRD